FDLANGQPGEAIEVEGATFLNGIAAAEDGTLYVSNTMPPETLFKVSAAGEVSKLVEGAPLAAPNGVALDLDGNVVVVNIGNRDVITFSPEGEVVKTEQAAEGGNDGVVV